MKRKIKAKKIAVYSFVFVLIFVFGFISSEFLDNLATQNSSKLSFVARRAQLENPNDLHINFSNLRNDLEQYVRGLGEDSDKVSIYFEYLPTGVSININESNESVAASLMKVPIVMTLYQAAREGKVDLDKKVALKQEWLNDEYGALYKEGVGHEITIREAARLAMVDSDNTAILLIFDQLDGLANQSSNVLSFLDTDYEVNPEERVLISARAYSSIIKCLYFACYNTKEDSQEILSYLTESSFDNRLVSKIPDDIKVAHKIGTFSTKFQSDCGVFYMPEKNYVLCVMVEGNDPLASNIISTASDKVYQYVKEKILTTNSN
jgi:beta-lactamase class A